MISCTPKVVGLFAQIVQLSGRRIDMPFDPYRQWLGISGDGPLPDHYQLLGLARDESDHQRIAQQAQQQMARVRPYRLGKHADLAQRLLDELAAAYACLSDADRRCEYDEQLGDRPDIDQGPIAVAIVADGEEPPPVQVPIISAQSASASNTGETPISPGPTAINLKRRYNGKFLTWLDQTAVTLWGEYRLATIVTCVALFCFVVVVLHMLLLAPPDDAAISSSHNSARTLPRLVQEPRMQNKSPDNGQTPLTLESIRTPTSSAPPRIQPEPYSPPPLLIAPFDAVQAAAGQRDWATHLGRSVIEENSVGMQLVLIPPGQFVMGSPRGEPGRRDDEDQVQVTISQPFLLGQHEVTLAQWEAVMGTRPWQGEQFVKEGPEYPASCVSWTDATEFCRRLTLHERRSGGLRSDENYMLPTDAQWEYACRAESQDAYSFGADPAKLEDYAWFGGNARDVGKAHPQPVGLKRPNYWKLHDMHGNLWEFCRDGYNVKLPGGTDPEGTFNKLRIRRGQGFGSSSERCRTANRDGCTPAHKGAGMGFRISVTISSKSSATISGSNR